MARVPSPRHPVHRRVWTPGLRKGDDSPLRTSFGRSAPETSPTRQLPTPRSLPCGLNATCQTQSPPCAEGSLMLSLGDCRVAPAAAKLQPRNFRVEICDAVVLDHFASAFTSACGPRLPT